MPVAFKWKIGKRGWGWTRKEWSQLARDTWEYGGQWWHENILPKKFTEEGAREYHYQKRTDRYMKRKQKKFGHKLPLVFTGRLRDQVRSRFKVTSSVKGATIRLYGPKYLYQYRKATDITKGSPDKAKEIREVTRRDEKAVTDAMKIFFNDQIQRREKVAGAQTS